MQRVEAALPELLAFLRRSPKACAISAAVRPCAVLYAEHHGCGLGIVERNPEAAWCMCKEALWDSCDHWGVTRHRVQNACEAGYFVPKGLRALRHIASRNIH